MKKNRKFSRKASGRCNDKAMRWGICKICKRLGFIMSYKPKSAILKGLDKSKYWKQSVCNHFIGGQSKDRNDFCYQPGTVEEAKPDEVDVTYRITGRGPPS